MRISILAALFVLFSANLSAQSKHTFRECRLSKNWMKNTEGVSCPACNEKTSKEKIARAAEQKRRDAEQAKKIAAAKLARQKEFEAEKARERAEAAAAKSGEVVINASPRTGNATTRKIAQDLSEKTIIQGPAVGIAGYNYFTNENDEQIFSNEAEWSLAAGIEDVSFTKAHRKNVGIVRFSDDGHWDFINVKGELLLQDQGVIFITHIGNDWFLIRNRNTGYSLYHFASEKILPLHHFKTVEEFITPLDLFLPIYSSNIEVNTRMDFNPSYPIHSRELKKNLNEIYPDIVNEELLKKYLFVLVQSDYVNVVDIARSFNAYKVYADEATRIEMYGMTSSGELETIKIK